MQNESEKYQIKQQMKPYVPKQQLLKCRLCTDIFKKPITISCGHTFCYNCIYNFMKLHSQSVKHNQQKSLKQQEKLSEEKILNSSKKQQEKNIPVPLCPVCSSLIWKPLKCFKQNLTISNLISTYKFKPAIDAKEIKYDQNIQNFTHKILLNVQKLKTDPLPFCFNQIHFKTCFIDDIQNEEPKSYIVIQWPSISQKKIGLAGKIMRVQESNHTHEPYETNYKAIFYGLFFVNIMQIKTIQINLNSRYYTNATFYTQQKFGFLTICTTEQMHSKNILNIESFDRFLWFYDTLNNPHYLAQIYQQIDQRVFLQRNNAQAMMYCTIRLLKMTQKQKKQIVQCFDEQIRIQKINKFLDIRSKLSIDELMNIKIPGKYNSNFVFGIIILLILLHWYQN